MLGFGPGWGWVRVMLGLGWVLNKMLVPKKNLVPKKLLVPKKMLIPKKMVPKKMLVPKKKFGLEKNFGPKKNFGPEKKFGLEKNFGPKKKFGPEIFLYLRDNKCRHTFTTNLYLLLSICPLMALLLKLFIVAKQSSTIVRLDRSYESRKQISEL